MSTFLQQLINGLSLGSIYALLALGYTMVYGIIKLLNFAHGDVYMLGAFLDITRLSVCTWVSLARLSRRWSFVHWPVFWLKSSPISHC